MPSSKYWTVDDDGLRREIWPCIGHGLDAGQRTDVVGELDLAVIRRRKPQARLRHHVVNELRHPAPFVRGRGVGVSTEILEHDHRLRMAAGVGRARQVAVAMSFDSPIVRSVVVPAKLRVVL